MLEEQQIKDTFNLLVQKLREIKSIFIEQFGEERVDFNPDYTLKQDDFVTWYTRQCRRHSLESLSTEEAVKYFSHNTSIIVYWPEVTISNESDMKHLIRDLYAKVEVHPYSGTMFYTGFRLNRTTYTDVEWNSDYMHSHISRIPKDKLNEFQSPCLGSGPIRDVVSILCSAYDRDWWESFVFELDRYVRVESTIGVPYRRMANISSTGSNRNTSTIYLTSTSLGFPTSWSNKALLIQNFVKHCCQNVKFRFSFNGSTYILAEEQYKYWIRISNEFIRYFDAHKEECNFTFDDLVECKVMYPCILKNQHLMELTNGNTLNYSERDTFVFKGVMQHLRIIRTLPLEQENIIYILSSIIAGRLYEIMPYVIDINYGKISDK